MKLYILDKTFELENALSSVEKIFDYIKEILDETEYNFSYLIIDGEEVHNEFETYLENNIKFIDEVKVVMLTIKEIVNENLSTIDEYITRAIPIVNKLADKFYREPNVEDWRQISELSDGIGFIFHTLESIDSMNDLNEIILNYEIWNEYVREVKSLEEILKELNSAMENGDTVLTADMLSYEIVPVFKKMKARLDQLV